MSIPSEFGQKINSSSHHWIRTKYDDKETTRSTTNMCPNNSKKTKTISNEVSEKTVIVATKVPLDSQFPHLEPFLVQTSGRHTGQHIALTKNLMRLGRDPSCEIVLEDPHVSRIHGEILKTGKKIILKDLGSTNGIMVNGSRLQECELQEGDKILIGTRLYFQFRILDAHEQISQQNLFNAANKDSLTGLYSRRYFQDVLAKEFSFSRRNQQPLSLMMVDLDFFKKINDTHGHLAGDEVLKKIGVLFQSSIRMENVTARFGGEEFVIILRNVNAEQARQIAERLRKTVAEETFSYQGKIFPVTLSIGIATLDGNSFKNPEDLIKTADGYLYEAKERGRNQVAFKK